jgi:hypothetical protein
MSLPTSPGPGQPPPADPTARPDRSTWLLFVLVAASALLVVGVAGVVLVGILGAPEPPPPAGALAETTTTAPREATTPRRAERATRPSQTATTRPPAPTATITPEDDPCRLASTEAVGAVVGIPVGNLVGEHGSCVYQGFHDDLSATTVAIISQPAGGDPLQEHEEIVARTMDEFPGVTPQAVDGLGEAATAVVGETDEHVGGNAEVYAEAALTVTTAHSQLLVSVDGPHTLAEVLDMATQLGRIAVERLP